MAEHISVKLNKVIHQKARLGIMSILMAAEEVEFNYLKSQLKLTDGNLSSHMALLEKHKLIKIKKRFVQKKPKTLCLLTETGHQAFNNYVNNLEAIIKNIPGTISGVWRTGSYI